MEDISKTKILSCGHVFCEECIESYHKYKKVCPTCGKTCGVIIGDQPEGKISVYFNNFSHCAGYEKYGRIEITYSFCDGKQGVSMNQECFSFITLDYSVLYDVKRIHCRLSLHIYCLAFVDY